MPPSSPFRPISWRTLRSFVEASPRWVVGVAVLTPAVALMQGTALLWHYRKHHLNAPHPISPSQGVVVTVADVNVAEEQRRRRKRKRQTSRLAAYNIWKSHDSKKELPGNADDDDDNYDNNMNHGLPPLRLLVIGDSLAAGVGVLRSATPVLPESIARTLSRRMGGRPVYWTCIGKPGAGLRDIIKDIETHQIEDIDQVNSGSDDEKNKTKKEVLLVLHNTPAQQPTLKPLWQEADRGQRLVQWWKNRKERSRKKDNNHEGHCEESKKHRGESQTISQWWKNLLLRVREELHSFQSAWNGPSNSSINGSKNNTGKITAEEVDRFDFDDDDEDGVAALATFDNEQLEDPFKLWQRWKRRLQKRQALMADDIVGEYDIAVVMTGANDIKNAWLPFMMPKETPLNESHAAGKQFHGGKVHADSESWDNNDNMSVPDRLKRVVTTLQHRMKLVLDGNTNSSHSDCGMDKNSLSSGRDSKSEMAANNYISTIENTQRNPPLVVFPAMPITLIPEFHSPPMSWFVFWIFRRLEEYKKAVAQQYPGAVVFVEPPPLDEFLSGDGKVLEDRKPSEEVIIALTNVTQQVRKKVEMLLKDYSEKWAKVLTEDHSDQSQNCYNDADDKCNLQQYLHHPDESYAEFVNNHHETKSRSSIMLSLDHLHPSDEGYEIWGRHIAAEILKKWNFQG